MSVALVKAGLDPSELRSRLVTLAEACSPEEWAQGGAWYGEGRALVAELSAHTGASLDACAAVVAHLSPRERWASNVRKAWLVARGEPVIGLQGPVRRARAALVADDPWSTFGNAPKTRSFAANLAGDDSAVTLDVWMLRAYGVEVGTLSRVGVYGALADILRSVAREYGVSPAQLQATLWVHVRGGGE